MHMKLREKKLIPMGLSLYIAVSSGLQLSFQVHRNAIKTLLPTLRLPPPALPQCSMSLRRGVIMDLPFTAEHSVACSKHFER